jgi:hypothetical protein
LCRYSVDEWADYFGASMKVVPGFDRRRACYPVDSAETVYADPEGVSARHGQRLWLGKGVWDAEAPADARAQLYPFGSCANDCQAGPGANGGDNGGGQGGGGGGSSVSIANFKTTLGGRLAAPGRTPAGGGGVCSCDYDGDEARPDCAPGVARPTCWCHYAWGEGGKKDCGGRTRTLNGETEPGGAIHELKAMLDTTWPTSWCFNGCSGHGHCMDHFCHCDAGFFGVDCSLTYTSAGGGRGGGGVRGTVPRITHHHEGVGGEGKRRDGGGKDSRRPLIYVYDLPPQFTVHQIWAHREGMGQDIGRDDGLALTEMALRSRHRTADPTEADFFLVPVSGSMRNSRVKALQYVRDTWPYFDATKDKGANHVWPQITPDYGPVQYTEISDYTR